MSRPTAAGSKLASKTNSALPSHRGVYIEVGYKGATEVINDLSQRFLAEQAKFREINRGVKYQDKAERNADPSINVIGFMLSKMAESNEYMEQLIQQMLDEADIPEKDAEGETMLVFQDSKGQVWELIKREDFQNFDELLETAEDEETAALYSENLIKLQGDSQMDLQNHSKTPVKSLLVAQRSHLHSFEEESSDYDSQEASDEEIGSNDYDQYEYERKKESTKAAKASQSRPDSRRYQGKAKIKKKQIDDGIKVRRVTDETGHERNIRMLDPETDS